MFYLLDLVWFLMSDSLSIVNLIDCFVFLSLNTCLKSPQSCGHCLVDMPLPTSNALLIAAKSPWINTEFHTHVNNPCKLPLCHSENVSVLSFTCITTQFLLLVILWQLNQRNLQQSTQTTRQPIWLYRNSLVGSCFCLLRLFQNHSLLSATVYTARTLHGLNPVSSVLILLAMKEQARHASLFQGLVPSSDVNCNNTHWFSPWDPVFSELKTPEVQAQISSPGIYYLLL